MAKRKFLSVGEMPLVGGALGLDFVNTTGARDTVAPRERLTSWRDVLVFCRRAGLLDRSSERRLLAESRDHPHRAARLLDRLRGLREAMYAVFLAAGCSQNGPSADLALLNEELEEASRHRRLAVGPSGPVWKWQGTINFDRIRWQIAYSAADLLTSGELTRMRQCAECDWLFLDTTKNGSRRWCKKVCGDRVKARRYYERHRAASDPRG